MMFEQWYNQTVAYHQPLLQDVDDDYQDGSSSSSSFVARLILHPPTERSAGKCILETKSTNLDNELSSLCVTGATSIQLGIHARKHTAYKTSWCGIITFWTIVTLSMFCVIVPFTLLQKHLNPFTASNSNNSNTEDDSDSDNNDWTKTIWNHILIYGAAFLVQYPARKAQSYVEQHWNDHRSKAIQTFHSDLQAHVTSIKEALLPYGYNIVMITKIKEEDENNDDNKNDDGTIEIGIEKTSEWTKDTSMPSPTTVVEANNNNDSDNNETPNQVVPLMTEVNSMLIQYGVYALHTPLDIWLFGGLMIRMQTAHLIEMNHSRQCGKLGLIPLLSFFLGYFYIVTTLRVLYIIGYILCGIVILFVTTCAIIYYREYMDASNLHSAWMEIVHDLSPLAKERVGYTMTYVIKPAGFLPKTTKGMIQFQQQEEQQEEAMTNYSSSDGQGLQAVQIV